MINGRIAVSAAILPYFCRAYCQFACCLYHGGKTAFFDVQHLSYLSGGQAIIMVQNINYFDLVFCNLGVENILFAHLKKVLMYIPHKSHQ